MCCYVEHERRVEGLTSVGLNYRSREAHNEFLCESREIKYAAIDLGHISNAALGSENMASETKQGASG